MNKFEVIIIGSGPGGAISAYELEKRNVSYIVLEAGSCNQTTELFSIKEMQEKYWAGGTTFIWGKTKIPYVTAKCVGGGSEINAGQYHRLPKSILNKWVKDYQFDKSQLEEQYTFIESILNIKEIPDQDLPRYSLKLKEAAERLNWDYTKPLSWITKESKHTMSNTFLQNINIKTDEHVLNIQPANEGWLVKSKSNTFWSKKLILSAGTIQTAHLLQRSKIKIKSSFSCHPMMKIQSLFEEPVNPTNNILTGIHQIKEFSPAINIGCSVSTLPYLILNNIAEKENIYKNKEYYANYYISILPESKGEISGIRGSVDPIVKMNLTAIDKKKFSQGKNALIKCLRNVGARKFWDGGISTVHLFSSLPSGENDSQCCVDSMGKVKGLSHLYINDGSLLPSPPSVNPQGIIMALARRNILHFIKENKY